jgi:hypothetical protein
MADGSGSIYSEVNLVKDENDFIWITSTDKIARLNEFAKNKDFVFEGDEDNIQVRLIYENDPEKEYLKLPLPIMFTTPEEVISLIDKMLESLGYNWD